MASGVILDDKVINPPVADAAARAAIPTGSLGIGCVVLQVDEAAFYHWSGSDWVKSSAFSPFAPWDAKIDGVGSDPGHYATLKDAIDAGKSYINYAVSGTESASITLTKDVYVYIAEGVTVSFGTSQIDKNATGFTLIFEGLNSSSSIIEYTPTVVGNRFITNGISSGKTILKSVVFKNLGSAADTSISESDALITYDCLIWAGNASNAGANYQSILCISDDTLISTDVNSQEAFVATIGIFRGTYIVNSVNTTGNVFTIGAFCKTYDFSVSGGSDTAGKIAGLVMGMKNTATTNVDLTVTASNTVLNSVNVRDLTIDATLTNVIIVGSVATGTYTNNAISVIKAGNNSVIGNDHDDILFPVSTETELQNALTAGETRLISLDDITFTSDLTWPNNNVYILLTKSWAFADDAIDVGSNVAAITIEGIDMNASAISYNPTTSHALFKNVGGGEIILSNMSILNMGSQADTPLSDGGTIDVSRVTMLGGSADNAGIRLGSGKCILDDVALSGNTNFIKADGANGSIIQNCDFGSGSIGLTNTPDLKFFANDFSATTVNIDVTCDDTVIMGCTNSGAVTLNDSSTTTHKAGNSADIGNDYTAAIQTHSTTWQGIWAAPQNGDITYVAHNHVVTLHLPSVLAAATIGATITNTTLLPTDIRPPTDVHYQWIRTLDDNTYAAGMLSVSVGGLITITKDVAGASFSGTSASGNSGFDGTSVVYQLA